MKNTVNQTPESTQSVNSQREIPEALPSVKLIFKQQQQLKEYQKQLDEQKKQLEEQKQQLELLTDQFSKDKHRASKARGNYGINLSKLKTYISGISGSAKYQPRFSLNQILFSYLGSFLGIAVLAYISVSTHYPLIAAPFGAAAVLVFAVPDSPLAQPRNCIVGNFLGALVSLVMVHLFGSEPWVMALAVATAIKVMQLTKTLHPPGGAVALVGVMSHAEWSFLFTPVLAGSVILVLCTVAFNNLMPGRSYPKHWL